MRGLELIAFLSQRATTTCHGVDTLLLYSWSAMFTHSRHYIPHVSGPVVRLLIRRAYSNPWSSLAVHDLFVFDVHAISFHRDPGKSGVCLPAVCVGFETSDLPYRTSSAGTSFVGPGNVSRSVRPRCMMGTS